MKGLLFTTALLFPLLQCAPVARAGVMLCGEYEESGKPANHLELPYQDYDGEIASVDFHPSSTCLPADVASTSRRSIEVDLSCVERLNQFRSSCHPALCYTMLKIPILLIENALIDAVLGYH